MSDNNHDPMDAVISALRYKLGHNELPVGRSWIKDHCAARYSIGRDDAGYAIDMALRDEFIVTDGDKFTLPEAGA